MCEHTAARRSDTVCPACGSTDRQAWLRIHDALDKIQDALDGQWRELDRIEQEDRRSHDEFKQQLADVRQYADTEFTKLNAELDRRGYHPSRPPEEM